MTFKKRIKINWEGSLFVHHSLGMVNRELLSQLINNPHLDIRHIPYEPNEFVPVPSSKYHRIMSLSNVPHLDADIHIRHKWPPDLSRPPSGKFILMQPWEYGSLPVDWLRAINSVVDQVWVYTRYLQTCYERSGVDPHKIAVVPLGIDPVLFRPGTTPLPQVLTACGEGYRFLYNGGVTTRKGTDILVNAYLSEFTRDEPVCLYIKASDVYRKGLSEKIKVLAARDDCARIVYSSDPIPHESLPSLYASCDCYVHPYRAEGYGLPIAEAMACGIPVIVTGGGACLDFVNPANCYFVKYAHETIPVKRVGDLTTIDFPFWLVPDTDHLRSMLRYVYTHREEAREYGNAAGVAIRSIHTWNHAAAIAQRHIMGLIDPSTNTAPATDTIPEKNELTDKAISLLQSGAFTEAMALFTTILHTYGDSSVAFEGCAIAAFHLKHYDQACSLFAAANRISPKAIDILLNWYEAAKAAGSVPQLIDPIRKVLQTDTVNNELRAIATQLGIV